MKRLTLVRHAQADSALPGQPDFERTLTRRGTQDATDMGRRFKQHSRAPDLIVASAAARASATAALFGNAMQLSAEQVIDDERLYTATVTELLEIVRTAPDCKHLLLVAHNPTITEFAERLARDRDIDAITTCGVVTMKLKIKSWPEIQWNSGMEIEIDYPSKAPYP